MYSNHAQRATKQHRSPALPASLPQEPASTQSVRAAPAFAATWDILRALARSELVPLPSTAASFIGLFRILGDMLTAHISVP